MAWGGVSGERKTTGSGFGGVLGETKIVWSGVSITVGLYPTCPTKTLVLPRFFLSILHFLLKIMWVIWFDFSKLNTKF